MPNTLLPLDLLRRFFQALKAVKMYGSDHPLSQTNLGTIRAGLESALTTEAAITFLCQGDTIVVQNDALPGRDQAVCQILDAMRSHGITSIAFLPGLPAEELIQCIKLLASKPESVMKAGEIKAEFIKNFTKIQINNVRYVAISEDDAIINTLTLLPDQAKSKRFASAIIDLSRQKEKSRRTSLAGGGGPGTGAEAGRASPSIDDLVPELQNLLLQGDAPASSLAKEASPPLPDGSQGPSGEIASEMGEARVLVKDIGNSLPQTSQDSQKASEKPAEDSPGMAATEVGRSRTVLVVDGNEGRQSAYKKVLEERSYAVSTASTAKEAIDKIFAQRNLDAIVMEVLLPDRSGGTILSKMLAARIDIPVVIAAPRASQAAFDFEILSYPDKVLLTTLEPALIADAVGESILRKEKKRRGAETAGRDRAKVIQEKLIPRQVPSVPGWEIAFSYKPSADGGGDYLDIIPIEGQKAGIILGNTPEKGLDGANVLSNLRIAFRLATSGSCSPRDSVIRANKLFSSKTPGGKEVRALCCFLDGSSDLLTFINCAHDSPFLLDVRKGAFSRLAGQGLPLGNASREEFEAGLSREEVTLYPGSQVILLSQSAIQAMNEEGDTAIRTLVLEAAEKFLKEDLKKEISYLESLVLPVKDVPALPSGFAVLVLRRTAVQETPGDPVPFSTLEEMLESNFPAEGPDDAKR